jgi:thiamine-phosphate diphosphorylase
MAPEETWLCLVTDRRRLVQAAGQRLADAPSADESFDLWWPLLQEQVSGAVRGGITLVQIRERDLDARCLLEVTRGLVAIAEGTRTRIVVNDRLDVARAGGAAGVHLRGNSPTPARVRPLTPAGWILGRSVHSVEEVAGATGADYLVAGTVFRSASTSDNKTDLGVRGLEAIVAAAGSVPVLAIGGITETTAAGVAATGVHGIASIGAFLPRRTGEDLASAVERQTDRLRRVFTRAARDL